MNWKDRFRPLGFPQITEEQLNISDNRRPSGLIYAGTGEEPRYTIEHQFSDDQNYRLVQPPDKDIFKTIEVSTFSGGKHRTVTILLNCKTGEQQDQGESWFGGQLTIK